jgi:hypothetical protein
VKVVAWFSVAVVGLWPVTVGNVTGTLSRSYRSPACCWPPPKISSAARRSLDQPATNGEHSTRQRAISAAIRMRDLAEAALAARSELPQGYWRLARLWFWLGVPAFIAMVMVVALMVSKHLIGGQP